MKKIIGITILSAFFLVIIIAVSVSEGKWWFGPAIFAASAVITAIIIGACYLIFEEKEDDL